MTTPTENTAMDKLKTAVIGYGKVAHTHAEALASIPESEFVAVCGRDAAKAQVVRRRSTG